MFSNTGLFLREYFFYKATLELIVDVTSVLLFPKRRSVLSRRHRDPQELNDLEHFTQDTALFLLTCFGIIRTFTRFSCSRFLSRK